MAGYQSIYTRQILFLDSLFFLSIYFNLLFPIPVTTSVSQGKDDCSHIHIPYSTKDLMFVLLLLLIIVFYYGCGRDSV